MYKCNVLNIDTVLQVTRSSTKTVMLWMGFYFLIHDQCFTLRTISLHLGEKSAVTEQGPRTNVPSAAQHLRLPALTSLSARDESGRLVLWLSDRSGVEHMLPSPVVCFADEGNSPCVKLAFYMFYIQRKTILVVSIK